MNDLAQRWNAIIIGAGVAGTSLAALLSRRGWKTLLVDRAEFPREKVCGCCVSPAATRLLRALELDDALRGGQPLHTARLYTGKRHYTLRHGGVSISREALDDQLAEQAELAGATFVSAAAATDAGAEGEVRRVNVRSAEISRVFDADVVFIADGIAGHFADAMPELQWEVATPSYMGVAAEVGADEAECPPGEVRLVLGRGGYVGLVRFEDGCVNVAGAFDPAIIRAAGGPEPLISTLLARSGIRSRLSGAVWQGTTLLSRTRAHLGAHRILAVGDACGYAEPYSGEGMKWAITSAVAVADLVGKPGAWNQDYPAQWKRVYKQVIAPEVARCARTSLLVRHPKVLSVVLRLAKPLAQSLVRRMHPIN